MLVDLVNDGLEMLVLLAVEADALLAGPLVHGALVDVPLADVDVRLTLEDAHLNGQKRGQQRTSG